MRKAFIATVIIILCWASRAEEPVKPYAHWPDTDPEWNALTNHIMWCYNALSNRVQVSSYYGFVSDYGWKPCLICPYRDYVNMARAVDEICDQFVRTDLAGEDGNFEEYFSTTNENGECPTSFPCWTPETLHSNAFGRTHWSTNNVLNAWMTITNRDFMVELAASIQKLEWTVVPGGGSIKKIRGPRIRKGWHFTNVLERAISKTRADFYNFGENMAQTGFAHVVRAQLVVCENGYYSAYSALNLGTGYLFEYESCFSDDNAVLWRKHPNVSSFLKREIILTDYTNSLFGSRVKIKFVEDLPEPARTNSSQVITFNPFQDEVREVFPLDYAELDGVENCGQYDEEGEYIWLLKWGAIENQPDPPIFDPVETLDSERDGLVDTGLGEGLPGAGTGTIVLTPEDTAPVAYLPLGGGAWQHERPVQAYFSNCSTNLLPYHYLNDTFHYSTGDLNNVEIPIIPFSTATRVEGVGCINSTNVHVKQALVVRPRGQVVVFEFPWEKDHFSRFGNPVGINKGNRYVLDLMATNESVGICASLLFPSKVEHVFITTGSYQESTCDLLWRVIDERGEIVRTLGGFDYWDFRYTQTPEVVTGGLYTVEIEWDREKIVPKRFRYYSRKTGGLVEQVDVRYDDNSNIMGLSKSDPSANVDVVGDGRLDYGCGIVATRTQTETPLGERTVCNRISSSANSLAATHRSYDKWGRLISEVKQAEGLTDDVTAFSYREGNELAQRYPLTGRLVSNSVSIVKHSNQFGDITVTYKYDENLGYVSRSSLPLGDGVLLNKDYEYYSPNISNLDYYAHNPFRAWEKSCSLLIDNDVHQKTFYVPGFLNTNMTTYGQHLVAQAANPSASMLDTANVQRAYSFVGRRLYRLWDPVHTNVFLFNYDGLTTDIRCGYDETYTQCIRAAAIDLGSRSSIIFQNPLGVVTYSKSHTRDWAVLEETSTDTDDRGRPTMTRFLDGTKICYKDYCIHGPRTIINRDQSETKLKYDPFGRITRREDGESGITYEYEYDVMGNVTHLTRSGGGRKAERFARYGLDGALLYTKDENGIEMSVSGQINDGYLTLTRKITGRGDVVETYWGDGFLKAVSGAGAPVQFDRERYVEGGMTHFKQINPANTAEWVKDVYSFNGMYAYTERPGGIIEQVGYDSRLNVNQTKDGDGVVRNVTHDSRNFDMPSLSGFSSTGAQTLDLSLDSMCTKREYSFTPEGLKTTVKSYPEDGSSEDFEEFTSSVNPNGMSGIFKVSGQDGSFTCDAPPSTGTYNKIVNLPGGGETIYTYRKFLLRQIIEKDSVSFRKTTTTYEYDGFGELVSYTTDKTGHKETVTVRRNQKGAVLQIRSTAKGSVNLSYNNALQLESASGPNGETTLDWHQNGSVSSVKTDEDARYSRTCDPSGRDKTITRTKGMMSSSLELIYGADGGFASKKRDGVTTLASTARRADGRSTRMELPGNIVLENAYNAIGQMTAETWTDSAGNLSAVDLRSTWMRDGSRRTYGQVGGAMVSNAVFRCNNRIASTAEHFKLQDGQSAAVNTSWLGPLGCSDGSTACFTGFTNLSMQVGAEYDSFRHLNLLTGDGFYGSFAGQLHGAITNTVLNVGSNRLSRTVVWGASSGKPARVEYVWNGEFLRRWQYFFAHGRVSRVQRSGGDAYRTDYAYDDAGQLKNAISCVTNAANDVGFPGLSFGYTYDLAGNTIAYGRSADLMSVVREVSDDLPRDRINVTAEHVVGRVASSNAVVKTYSLSYTNVATAAGGLFHSAAGSFEQSNMTTAKVLNVTVTASLQGGSNSDTGKVSFVAPSLYEYPRYHASGALLADSRRSYTWDAAGRLTSVSNGLVSPATQVAFEYYPDGRRARKSVRIFTNGVWTASRSVQYAWQGWKLAAECERDASGSVSAVRHFVWGPDIVGQQSASLDSDAEGVGGLLLIREWKPARGERAYLPLTDGLGSVCGLIDASDGSLAAEFDYDPYGNPVIGRGPAMDACPFRHRTRCYDPETWLYYYGYRYYDPSVTKWISKDPLGEEGGWNLTAFCDNDPVNKFDPLGLAHGDEDEPNLAQMITIEFDAARMNEAIAEGVSAVGRFGRDEILRPSVRLSWRMTSEGLYYGAFKWLGGDYEIGNYRVTTVFPRDGFSRGNPASGDVLVFINGILNSWEDNQAILEERITSRGTRTGIGIHNSSTMEDPIQSWLVHIPVAGNVLNTTIAVTRDVIQTAGQKLCLPDQTARYAAQTIEVFNQQHADLHITELHCHSQGGAIGSDLGTRYLSNETKSTLDFFTYGSAASPSFGWRSQHHIMNLYDPVPHISGRGGLFLPVALMEHFVPSVTHEWITEDQHGSGWWYHSWFPSYEGR